MVLLRRWTDAGAAWIGSYNRRRCEFIGVPREHCNGRERLLAGAKADEPYQTGVSVTTHDGQLTEILV